MSSGHFKKITISSCFSLWKHFFGLFQKKRPKIEKRIPIMIFFFIQTLTRDLLFYLPVHLIIIPTQLMRTNLRKTAENSWSATFCSDFVSWSWSQSSVKNQAPLRIRFNSHRNNIFILFPKNFQYISPDLF